MRPILLSCLAAVFVAGVAVSCQIAAWSPHCVPGVYQSRSGTQFYDDARDVRPPIAYDLEQLLSPSGRSILGGTIEPMGAFEVERAVPFGVRIKVLSGRYRGDHGYIKTRELSQARRKEQGR